MQGHAPVGPDMPPTGDQHRDVRFPRPAGHDHPVGHRRVLGQGDRQHRVEHGLGQLLAVAVEYHLAHFSALVFIDRLVQHQGLRAPLAEGVRTLARDAFGHVPVQSTGQQRHVVVKRLLSDRLIHLPVRPAAFFPADGRADPRRIVRIVRQMRIQWCLLRFRQHFEYERGPATICRHFRNQLGLEPVMVGIIVLLADQHEIGLFHGRVNLAGGGVPPLRRLPDLSGQGVVPIQGRFPASFRCRRVIFCAARQKQCRQ